MENIFIISAHVDSLTNINSCEARCGKISTKSLFKEHNSSPHTAEYVEKATSCAETVE